MTKLQAYLAAKYPNDPLTPAGRLPTIVIPESRLTELSRREAMVTVTDCTGRKFTGVLSLVWQSGRVGKLRIGRVGFGAVTVDVGLVAGLEVKD